MYKNAITFSELQSMPPTRDCFIYCKDGSSTYQWGDIKVAKVAGCRDITGKIDVNLPWAPVAEELTLADSKAYSGQTVHIFELTKSAENISLPIFTCKKPLLDQDGKICGIAGSSILLDYVEFVELASTLNLTLLPNKEFLHYYIDDLNLKLLTERESECLFYLLQGKSMRQIALLLKVSQRTVESHIEHIKFKCGVKNKDELFELAIRTGLISIIPKNLFNLMLAEKLKS
jgi:DNA-binding CsgD family transcriptional regulator